MSFHFKLRRLTGREIRFLCLLAIVAAAAWWKFAPRPWHATSTRSTAHFEIASTAQPDQIERVGNILELLYAAYSNKFSSVPTFQHTHPKLKVRLYKSRDEFRKVNPSVGWAEAFYSRGLCHAYFSDKEANPYQWMLHEAVHQLNHEVAGFDLEKWLEEGLAEYFSCSRIRTNELAVGTIDLNTNPVWCAMKLQRQQVLKPISPTATSSHCALS
ncbi:MAG: putative lipoprotein [Verrucomicrobiales bacterium]|nr:putative lipoprotein [Verrucomicrobiales bacterium]